MNTTKLHILIIDDHPMVLRGMHAILSSFNNVQIVHDFQSAEQALESKEITLANLIITDIHLPGMDGILFTQRVLHQYPEMKLIAMSTSEDRAHISAMIAAGVHGYISKSCAAEEINEVVRMVMQNELAVKIHGTPEITIPSINTPVITRREKEVLHCIANGLTNKEIASKLFISQNTVDSHRKNLLLKFDVQNTAALITKAAKQGIL